MSEVDDNTGELPPSHAVDRYGIWTVDRWELLDLEQVGRRDKDWLLNPKLEKWLIKYPLLHDSEIWAEKVASELAALLALPHARYEIANRDGRAGIITQTFVREGEQLFLGNQLLGLPGEVSIRTRRMNARSVHSLENIARRVENCLPPSARLENESVLRTGLDFFVGYLIFDAWIGNTECNRSFHNSAYSVALVCRWRTDRSESLLHTVGHPYEPG